MPIGLPINEMYLGQGETKSFRSTTVISTAKQFNDPRINLLLLATAK